MESSGTVTPERDTSRQILGNPGVYSHPSPLPYTPKPFTHLPSPVAQEWEAHKAESIARKEEGLRKKELQRIQKEQAQSESTGNESGVVAPDHFPEDSGSEMGSDMSTYSHSSTQSGSQDTVGVIDELMKLVALEKVKEQFLAIKSKVEICHKQKASFRGERFHAVFQGNPGTGMRNSAPKI